jgi:hypothetical protein
LGFPSLTLFAIAIRCSPINEATLAVKPNFSR